ncbi:unnamed protein product [Brassica oleracea]
MHVLELNQLTDLLSSLDRLKTKCDVDAPVSFVQDLEHHRDDLFSRIYGIELTSFSKQDLLLHPMLDKAFGWTCWSRLLLWGTWNLILTDRISLPMVSQM